MIHFIILFFLLCVFTVLLTIFAQIHIYDGLYYTGYVYKKNDFPIPVFYEYNPNRRTNLGNEYEIVQASLNDINNKVGFVFFTLLPPGMRPMSLKDVLHMKDSTFEHECSLPFDGVKGVVAHAYFPPEKKICVDASENWNPRRLGNALVHELGHSLGLLHDRSKKYRSIMQPELTEDIEGLQPADVEKLKLLYPFV